MRYASLCDGIGAVHCAWQPLGWQCLWTSEIEPFPIAVVEERWGFKNVGDMTLLKEGDVEPVELLVAGTPCQSFSAAGKRRGMQDERGQLASHFLRIVGFVRPKWVVWENVPGALQTNRGRDFGSILGTLADLGYGVAYRVLDAAGFGVPQRRERVFVVGCLGDWSAPVEILSLSSWGGGHSEEAGQEGHGDRAGRKGHRTANVPGEWWNGQPVSQTLDAVLYKKQCLPEKNRFPAVMVPAWVPCDSCEDFICQLHGCHAHECGCPPVEEWPTDPYSPCLLRFITPPEAERLQGFPDDYTAIDGASDTKRYKAIGNSMCVPLMRWLGSRIEAVAEKAAAQGHK